MNLYSSFIPNLQKLEGTQMSFNRRMNKQTVVYPHNRILFRNRKE